MKLDTKQKNNLLTGVKLATELKASLTNLRKFITIYGYTYDDDNKYKTLSKALKPHLEEEVYFELRCYEIPIEYYENSWDVTEDDLINEIYKDDIKGVEELEIELKNYIQDFSVLKPVWYCDNLL